MVDFLLLHGMSVGGWEWERVVPLLQAHPAVGRVVAPDFPGRNAARGEYGAIRLAHYADTALRALREQDLRDVVLVGHSGGGTCMQAIVAAEPERVRRMVFLCAAIPENGGSLLDQQPALSRLITRAVLKLSRAERRGIVPVRRLAERALCHDLEPEHCEQLTARLVPEPTALLTDRIGWDAGRVRVPATYILTTKDRIIPAKQQEKMARSVPGIEIVRFPTGHGWPVVYPERLVAQLLRGL